MPAGSSKTNSRSSSSVHEAILQRIRNELTGFEWTVEGASCLEQGLLPFPKESRVVTAFIEEKAKNQLKAMLEQRAIQLIPADHSRQYPDATLTAGPLGDSLIALDIKTARRKSSTRASKMTLGSYTGYFCEPSKESQYCKYPYGAYLQHWIAAFIYEWYPDKNTLSMVNITDVIVYPKWKLASKSTGSGTTRHIGGVNNLKDLRNGNGDFSSKEDFEEYWRTRGLNWRNKNR